MSRNMQSVVNTISVVIGLGTVLRSVIKAKRTSDENGTICSPTAEAQKSPEDPSQSIHEQQLGFQHSRDPLVDYFGEDSEKGYDQE